MKTPDPDRIVELCKTQTTSEADIIVALLKDEGIPAMGPGTVADPFGGSLDVIIPTRVRVRAADLEAARDLLDQNRQHAADIDWDTIDWQTPASPEEDFDAGEHWMDKGLFIKVVAAVVIMVLILALISSVIRPGSNSGLFPGN